MTIPTYCTLDGNESSGIYPYTPSVADMGGAAFVNDDVYPPKENENVTAEAVNQMQKLIVRACKMMPKASFHVSLSSGVASLVGFTSCSDNLNSSNITVSLNDHFSTGNTVIQIRWPLHSIPQAAIGPNVSRISKANADTTGLHVSQYADSDYAYVLINVGSLTAVQARVDVDGEGTFAP